MIRGRLRLYIFKTYITVGNYVPIFTRDWIFGGCFTIIKLCKKESIKGFVESKKERSKL